MKSLRDKLKLKDLKTSSMRDYYYSADLTYFKNFLNTNPYIDFIARFFNRFNSPYLMQLYRLPDTRIKKESDNSLWVLFEI
jgi:hypothetical protein